MADTAAAHRMGVIYVTAAAVAWSTGGVFVRYLSTDIATTILWRNLFACLGLLAVLLLTQGFGGLAIFRRMTKQFVLFSCVAGLTASLMVPALQLTSVAHVVVIYATAPFLAGGIVWAVYGQEPRRIDVIASFVALFGAVYMIGLSNDGGWLGDLFSFLMTLSLAFGTVLMWKYPDTPALAAIVTGFALSTLVSLFFVPDFSLPIADLPVLAGFGLITSALGSYLFFLGARLLRPVETTLLGALETPLAPLMVWVLIGETVGLATFIGGSIVMAAVVWHALRSAKPE